MPFMIDYSDEMKWSSFLFKHKLITFFRPSLWYAVVMMGLVSIPELFFHRQEEIEGSGLPYPAQSLGRETTAPSSSAALPVLYKFQSIFPRNSE